MLLPDPLLQQQRINLASSIIFLGLFVLSVLPSFHSTNTLPKVHNFLLENQEGMPLRTQKTNRYIPRSSNPADVHTCLLQI
jgi:hypothetical protein